VCAWGCALCTMHTENMRDGARNRPHADADTSLHAVDEGEEGVSVQASEGRREMDGGTSMSRSANAHPSALASLALASSALMWSAPTSSALPSSVLPLSAPASSALPSSALPSSAPASSALLSAMKWSVHGLAWLAHAPWMCVHVCVCACVCLHVRVHVVVCLCACVRVCVNCRIIAWQLPNTARSSPSG
jgi:hypothetical protein